MKRILAFVLAAIMVCFCFTACQQKETGDTARVTEIKDKTIKLGLVAPLTGSVAVYGVAVQKGVQMAVKEINADSSVLGGYTIELVEKDDMGDPTNGAAVFTSLADDSSIAAIIGPVTTGVTSTATSIANEAGIVMVTPTSTGDAITTESDYVFRSCYKDSYQGKMAADYAKELGYKEVAVLYAKGDTYSAGLRDAFVQRCSELGITVAIESTSATISNETTFDAQLTTIIGKIGNEGFLYAPYYYDAAGPMIIPQARKQGFTGVIMGVDGYDGMIPDYISGDKSAYNNVFFPNHYSTESTDQKVVDFIKSYSSTYNEAPNAFAALGYDGAYMLVSALEKVLAKTPDSISGADLKAAMDGMSFKGVTGDFVLDEAGTPAKSVVIIEYYYDDETDSVASRFVKTLG